MTRLSVQVLIGITALSTCVYATSNPHLKGWEEVNLKLCLIADSNVYVEPGLESWLPVVEEHLHSAQQNRQFFNDPNNSKVVLETINELLGIDDSNLDYQCHLIKEVTPWIGVSVNPLYLVRQTTIKKLLRSGTSIPGFSYDPNEDVAICHNQFENTKKHSQSSIPLTIPISDEHTKSEVTEMFGLMSQLTSSPGVIVHEVTEITLLKTINATDAYCRWFSDGFANAITYCVLEKHQGPSAAQDFARLHDPNSCSYPKNQIHLQYWLNLKLALLGNFPPIAELSSLDQARYSYATYEASRLMERHGTKIIAQIVSQLSKRESRGGEDILAVIGEITGEDMKARMRHYQDFSTPQEVVTRYRVELQQAIRDKEWKEALIKLNFLYELDEPHKMDRNLPAHFKAANLLFELGHELVGDKVMYKCINLMTRSVGELGRGAAEEQFMSYALECRNPDKALAMADRHLKDYPQKPNTMARTIKMYAAFRRRNFDEAKTWAKSVIKNSPNPNSRAVKLATKVIDTDFQ
jgi:hypothetical protein